MESGNHGQHHEHHHHDFSETETLGGAFSLNLTFTLIEIAGGLWTNSVAIIADRFMMLVIRWHWD